MVQRRQRIVMVATTSILHIIKVLQGDENYVNWRFIARELNRRLSMIW